MPAYDLAALELVKGKDGTRVRLRVQPGARRDAIVGVHGGALRVAVTAPADRGKANESVIAVLARALGLPKGAVAIRSGAASRSKTVVVPLDPGAVRERLEADADVQA